MSAYAAALLYGWWHRSAHATFEVQFVYNRASGMANRLRNGQIAFLDETDATLARATIDTRRGVVWLAHPERGQCGPTLPHTEYLECFRAQSAWIALWASRVRHANVTLEGCSMSRVHVTLFTRRDNLSLWWAPLPQAAGRPYTRHIATVAANQQKCGG